MPAKPPAVNTFELQRAIRDAAPLSKAERAVLIMATTYLPNARPSWDMLAYDTGLHRTTVRKAAYSLRDRGLIALTSRGRKPALWAFSLDAFKALPRTPKKPQGVISDHSDVTSHVISHHTLPVISHHTEETRKRQDQDKTRQDTEISHVATPSEGPVRPVGQVDKGEVKTGTSDATTPSSPRSAAQKLAAWSEVWCKVLGPKAGPLPSVGQLKAWRADCTEAIFSATLADVASSVAQGKVSEPRALFRANLRSADPKAPAWTKEQICAIVDPAAPTPRPASRNPAYQPVVVRERQRPMNAEEKKAAMALIAKARRELMGEKVTA